MRIRWTVPAFRDFHHIAVRLSRESPHTARDVLKTLHDGIISLKDFPYRAPAGRSKDTRDLVCLPYPYTAVYRVTGQIIEVLHIYHQAQDWP